VGFDARICEDREGKSGIPTLLRRNLLLPQSDADKFLPLASVRLL
jgi:hypothetical protein